MPTKRKRNVIPVQHASGDSNAVLTPRGDARATSNSRAAKRRKQRSPSPSPSPITSNDPCGGQGAESDEQQQLAAQFDEFSIDSIIPYSSMLMYGARRIGKTHLMTHIMSKIGKRFDEIYLFSGTAEVQPDAWRFIPKCCKVAAFDESRIQEIMDVQSERIAQIRSKIKNVDKRDGAEIGRIINKKCEHVMLIFDDIVSDRRVVRSGMLDNLYTLGRHLRISQVILSQNANAQNSVGLSVRNNVDYVFTSCMPSEPMYERLAENYFGVEGKKQGVKVLKAITSEDYTFAVAEIHKSGRRKLKDYVRKIKAPPKIPRFKAGPKELWEHETQKGSSRKGLTAAQAKVLVTSSIPRPANNQREAEVEKLSEAMDDSKATYYNIVDLGGAVY